MQMKEREIDGFIYLRNSRHDEGRREREKRVREKTTPKRGKRNVTETRMLWKTVRWQQRPRRLGKWSNSISAVDSCFWIFFYYCEVYTCRVKINFKSSKKSVIVKNLMTKIGPANMSGLTPFSRLLFLFCFFRMVLVTTPTEIFYPSSGDPHSWVKLSLSCRRSKFGKSLP